MKDEKHSSGSMLISFLLGGIVGAVLAFLLPSEPGGKTGKKTSDVDEVKDRLTYYDTGG